MNFKQYATSILLTFCMADLSYSGAVDRIFPYESTANRFALRSLANGNYVGLSGSDLVASSSILSDQYLFEVIKLGDEKIALKSLANGKIVSAEDAGNSNLEANRDNIGDWEALVVTDLGNYDVALMANVNGKYVTAENGGSSPLIANRPSVGLWETFRLLPVIDMAEVITAFPKYYPYYVKNKTHSHNTECRFFDNKQVYERWVTGKVGQELVNISVSWDNVRIIDWIWLASDRVGHHGSFPMCQESEVENPPNTCSVGIWDQMIPIARRYLTPDMGVDYGTISETINETYMDYSGRSDSNIMEFKGSKVHGNEVHRFGYEDMGGNVSSGNLGARWYLKIASDLTINPAFTKEYFTWDLGPSPNVYSPKYGILMYEQTNKPACEGNSGTGGYTIEKYGDLSAGPAPSGGFFDYFSYDGY